MIYSEKQYKELEAILKRLKKENEIEKKENRLLKEQNKHQAEIISDLDKNNYKEKYTNTLFNYNSLLKINSEQNIEIEELKKKVEDLKKQLATQKVRIEKNSSNSSKPSSTNGFKKVITNRREKSDKKKGRPNWSYRIFLK